MQRWISLNGSIKGENVMTAKIRISNRIVSTILSIALLITCIPFVLTAATTEASAYALESDPSTVDGWKHYFPVSGDLTTINAGAVWTDKSVFKNGTTIDGKSFTIENKNSFLVALSAIGSNMSVTGKAAAPTDTVMVLDTSGSMEGAPARAMINAVNVAMGQLMEANEKNRVAVVFFANNRTTFLPLAHYKTTDSSGRFLNINNSGTSITLNSGVRNADGNRVYASQTSWPVNDGTYTAGGLKYAMNVLTANSNVLDQQNAPRIPVVMLFSDGIPTRAANNFSNPPESASNSGIGNGQSDDAGVAEVFATELTASYVKSAITEKYGKDYGCLFYTLGMEVSDTNALRECILDPQNKNTTDLNSAWSRYNALSTGSSVTIDNERFTKISTELSLDYVDRYFDIDSYQNSNTSLENALKEAFKDVVSEIVSKSVYSPTLLEGSDHNLSGYVSFVDKIGAYMNVTDIKGIMSGGKLFTGEALAHALTDAFNGGTLDENSALVVEGLQSGITRLGIDVATAEALLKNAYDHGQISYDPTIGEFSNWVGWISDAQGAYLDMWYEGMTLPVNAAHINASYIFLGAEGNTDMMYTTVRVREKVNAGVPTGEQDVAFAVPASLLPKITYKVDLDENKNVSNIEVTPDTPIHLIYEVGLDPEINSYNIKDKVSASYLSANTDPVTGEVYFYTNAWERTPDENGKLTGYGKVNTYSYFRPSHQNDRYYYQHDSLVYSDTEGTVYNGSAHPSTQNGKMYYYYSYYEKVGSTYKTVIEHHELPKEVLSVAVANGDGTYTVKAGTIRNDYNEDAGIVPKESNPTGTLANSHETFCDSNSYAWDDASHDAVVGITMSNNGRISVAPQTGIKITKELASNVELNGEDPIFVFEVVSAGQNGEYDAYAYRYVNGALVGKEETVTFDNGKAEVALKAGETIYVVGLTVGNTVTVTEKTYIDFVVQSVAIGGTVLSGTTAGAVIVDGEIKAIDFVNTLRGTGNFTVAKEIIHNYGASYVVPENENTAFEVELSFLFDGKPLSGDYVVAHTNGAESGIKLKGTAGETVKIVLRHDDRYTVYGLPEGTVVTAKENLTSAQQGSFTPSFENGVNEATVKVNSTVQIIINNTYKAEAANPTVKIGGTKTLTGNDYSGSFTFTLQRYNGTGAHIDDSSWTTIEQKSVTYTNSNGNETFRYDYDFSMDSFTEIGTYVYRIKEEKPAAEGIVYDTRIHTFQIDVTDNDMDGKLEASVSTTRAPQVVIGGSGESWTVDASFTNEYVNDHVITVLIGAQKEVTNLKGSPLGTSLAGFEFALYGENGQLIETLTTTSIGSVIFSRTYKASDIGTHVYTLKEIAPANIPAGWDYTKKEVKITVTVSQVVGENHLQATVVTDDNTATVNGTNAAVTFTNTYSPSDASLTVDFVSKEIVNGIGSYVLKDGEFSFAIYEVVNGVRGNTPVATGKNGADGKVVFDKALTYDKVGGPYYYEIVEIKPDNAPSYITYDSTVYKMLVTVTDEGGRLVATPVIESVAYNDIVFKNVYTAEPTTLVIEGTKTLTGRPLLENDFQFILSEVGTNNVWYAVNKAPNGDTAAFAFKTLTYTQVGTYTYEVSEYNPAESDATYFDGVKYDDTVYTLVVTVTDNGEGKLVATYTVNGSENEDIAFLNTYAPNTVSFKVSGTKALIGRDLLPTDKFTFDLYEATYDPTTQKWAKGSVAIRSAENDIYGAIAFGEITVDKAGTYRYIATERNESGNGITFDSTEWKVIVTVSDDQHGNLRVSSVSYINDNGVELGMVFENTYTAAAGDLAISGTKTLVGRTLNADEFSFTLYQSDENRTEKSALQTVKNGADGSFAFDEITYDTVGTYYYLVKEDAGSVNGVTYDTSVYFVKVTVTDDLNGKLVATYTVYDEADAEQNAIVFRNTYTATASSVILSGGKTLIGRPLKADEFSFTLYESDASKTVGSALQTVKNGADGTFAFAELSFDTVGTYYYLVKEDAGNVAGVTYDKAVYLIKVEVTDDLNGKLLATYTLYDETDAIQNAIKFENKYSAVSGGLVLNGIKTLIGRPLNADEFSFTLYESDATGAEGSVLQTVANGADGTFAFRELSFDTVGTYYYLVKEDAGNVAGVTYDLTVYLIKVEVTDDLNGKLLVTCTVSADGSDKTDIAFENTYSADNPETGDNVLTWLVPVAVSGVILATLIVLKKKKKDEDDE